MTTYHIATRGTDSLRFWTGTSFSSEFPDAKSFSKSPTRVAARFAKLLGSSMQIYRDYGLETETLVWDSDKLVAPESGQVRPEPAKMVKPVVHLNGTDRGVLTRQYHQAYLALHDALVALRKLDIHDRDYYPLGIGAGAQARRENEARLDRVASVMAEVEELYKAVDYRTEPECAGHPAGPADPMGQTVYCDGSCR